ncbi:MAG: GNAT family N-acetyltransferase, partial [Actinomycetota bacterium]|nr:GNAT family N-acetyltransferase [Actinomycetota bacterium]
VGVLPTHRRRGILRGMMRAQLDDVHARGEPVAYLWASEETIYGRFGYGMASLAGEIDLARDRSAFAVSLERRGTVRLVSRDEALELLPPIYERVALDTPGMFARTPGWWDARTLADKEWQRRGDGELNRAVLEVDGEPEAYALYRVKLQFDRGASAGYTRVVEAMGVNPRATAEIWRLVLDVDWMDRVKAGLLPIDHPLFLLLAQPRRMAYRMGDGVWVRLVDVEAALRARSYRAGEPVVLDVGDAFCTWNEGRYRVGAGDVARTDEAADVRLDVSALGSVYLGGFTFAQLARAGRADELREGGLARADDLFRTDVAPWCPEIF